MLCNIRFSFTLGKQNKPISPMTKHSNRCQLRLKLMFDVLAVLLCRNCLITGSAGECCTEFHGLVIQFIRGSCFCAGKHFLQCASISRCKMLFKIWPTLQSIHLTKSIKAPVSDTVVCLNFLSLTSNKLAGEFIQFIAYRPHSMQGEPSSL